MFSIIRPWVAPGGVTPLPASNTTSWFGVSTKVTVKGMRMVLGRQEAVGQDRLHVLQRGVADEVLDRPGEEAVMHRGHGEAADLEAVEAGRLRRGRRRGGGWRGLRRGAAEEGRRGQQRGQPRQRQAAVEALRSWRSSSPGKPPY